MPRSRVFLNTELLLVSAITVLAVILRVVSLTSKSFWMDEGFSMFMGRTSTSNFVRSIRFGEMNMVGYYALLRVWLHFGSSEFLVRLFSVIPSSATIPAVYFLGRRLFEARVGFVAALLLAIHPSHIAYAQEARGYALAVFLISLSSLCFLNLIQEPSPKNIAAYVVLTALAIYSHLLAALVVLAQWMSLLASSRQPFPWRTFAKAGIPLTLLLLPMIVFVLRQGSAVANWIMPPTWRAVLDLVRFLTLPRYWAVFYLFLWSVAFWAPFATRAGPKERWPYQFLFSWLLLPIILVLLVSLWKPLLVSRFMLICVPAAVLVASRGLLHLPRWGTALMFAIILAASLNSTLSYYRHPHLKEDWRGASQYVFSQSRAGDALMVLPTYGSFVLDYYRAIAQERSSSQILPNLDSPGTLNSERIWLVVYGDLDRTSPSAAETVFETLRDASGHPYCEVQSKQLTFIKVRLLARC